MNYNDYMKAYRSKNRDRINAQQRARRRSKPVMVKPTIDIPEPVEPAISKPREIALSAGKCIYCHSRDTLPVTIQGVAYALCHKHKAKHS